MTWERSVTGQRIFAVAFVFGIGVLVGLTGSDEFGAAYAQNGVADAPLSEDAENEIRAVGRSLSSAVDELESAGRYVAATTGANPFLVLSGGGDAMADLESDNGVDPETFAALYAGRVNEEIKDNVSIDDEGRVLYKGRVVRMYSVKRLKEMYQRRDALASDG